MVIPKVVLWMTWPAPMPSCAVAHPIQPMPTGLPADEIDSILSERSSSEHEASRRLKTEFLVQVGWADPTLK